MSPAPERTAASNCAAARGRHEVHATVTLIEDGTLVRAAKDSTANNCFKSASVNRLREANPCMTTALIIERWSIWTEIVKQLFSLES